VLRLKTERDARRPKEERGRGSFSKKSKRVGAVEGGRWIVKSRVTAPYGKACNQEKKKDRPKTRKEDLGKYWARRNFVMDG